MAVPIASVGRENVAELNVIVISGLSGSGKSLALKSFEDIGYFCVDNLPPALLPTFVELCSQQKEAITNVALGIDIRERSFLADLIGVLEQIRNLGHTVHLLFFEAREEVLVRRFSESRRPHPLLPQVPVLEGVRFEKERLAELRRYADRVIDTSDLTVHELRSLLTKQFRSGSDGSRLAISLLTFGYKFGVPYDIDLLFDVRFLKNPYFVPELKPLAGDDPRVKAFVLADPHAQVLVERLEEFLRFLIPCYEREPRSYLTIAIGCTGGRHRSVAIASHLYERLTLMGHEITLIHRDIHKL
ncbi:MAG: RNase adapter RapZ [Nitrospira sp.]|nr:RNase adapter RapZ [Nitrospira sp.]